MRRWGDWVAFAALVGGAVLMVGPFVWMVSTSLKPMAEQFDMALIPHTPTLRNYPQLFDIMPFHLMLWNSFKLSAISVAGQLLTCSMAAFIFAVVRFPFRNALFVLLLATLMVPVQVTVIPQFIIFKALGLYGTQAPLYLPSFLGGAFGTFLMRQYFLTIPIELAEAARIDGASLSRIFFTIYLPLSQARAGGIRDLCLPVFVERPLFGVDLSALGHGAHDADGGACVVSDAIWRAVDADDGGLADIGRADHRGVLSGPAPFHPGHQHERVEVGTRFFCEKSER